MSTFIGVWLKWLMLMSEQQAHRNTDAHDDNKEEEIEMRKEFQTTGLESNKIVWYLKEGIR